MAHDYAPLLTPTTFSDHRRFLGEVIPSLADAQVDELVELLYQVAVALRMNGLPQKSFKMGQLVHLIGRRRKSPYATGLGDMLRGDARNIQYRLPSAWHYLMKARNGFDPADAFNRARPVIGLLFAAVEVNKVSEITGPMFVEAEMTFKAKGDIERLWALYRNRGILHRSQGHLADLDTAQIWYERALRLAEADQSRKLIILGDLATLAEDHGNARAARAYFEQIYSQPWSSDLLHRLMALHNLASTEKLLGHYRVALQCLDKLLDIEDIGTKENQQIYLHANLTKLGCYLALNKFEEVEHTAQYLLLDTVDLPIRELSMVRYLLAQALSALGEYGQAFEQIRFIIQAETSREQNNAAEDHIRVMQARLLRGQIAHLQGDTVSALTEGEAVLRFFNETRQAREQAAASLLLARVHLDRNELPLAERYTNEAIAIGKSLDAQLILYQAFIVLGHVRKAQGDIANAQSYYEDSIGIIEQSERELTVLLRPGFLGDKGEPLQALMTLHLEGPEPRAEQKEWAFATLERSKSRAVIEYLVDNDSLELAADPLAQKLDQLRSDYMGFNAKAGDDSADRTVRQAARAKAERIKEAMAEMVRRVYQDAEGRDYERLHDTPPLAEIQRILPPDTLLIEYYNDGQAIYAFTIDRMQVGSRRLDATMAEVRSHFGQLEKRVQAKLAMLKSIPVQDGSDPLVILHHPYLNDLEDNQAFNQAAAALYDALIRPLLGRLMGHTELIIVPYGQLHDLPFHLLYDSGQGARRDGVSGRYLIQDYQVVLLPAASLLTRPPLAGNQSRRLVLFDDWQGRLRHSEDDATQIATLLGGEKIDARQFEPRALLGRARGQILHIVAHGQFDSAHPELSYLQLGREPLLMADLFRLGLAFQLVTLTSCEAGKLKLVEYANAPSSGDDLIGLGRAFLYTGTRSLMISRWHIGDGLTLPVVKPFYQAILQGMNKSQALRCAQLALLDKIPTLHPVLWGVFQLIGDATPLCY